MNYNTKKEMLEDMHGNNYITKTDGMDRTEDDNTETGPGRGLRGYDTL